MYVMILKTKITTENNSVFGQSLAVLLFFISSSHRVFSNENGLELLVFFINVHISTRSKPNLNLNFFHRAKSVKMYSNLKTFN